MYTAGLHLLYSSFAWFAGPQALVYGLRLKKVEKQRCSGVGTAFPHLFVVWDLFSLVTLLENLDLSFQFVRVASGAA